MTYEDALKKANIAEDTDEGPELKPVSEWVWNRYVVRFFNKHGRCIHCTSLVCTDAHVEHVVGERLRLPAAMVEWELIDEDVAHPPAIGILYGLIVYHDGWDI